MRSFFVAIEGAIGVGKTTLARLLQPRLGTGLLLEAFEENPFLADFYADAARYAFQTQMFFLLSRYQQQQVIPALLARGPLVADYMFAKDSLFARLTLKGDELDVYNQLYDVLADRIPVPGLVIYLRGDTDVLMARIRMRDRSYEREMDRGYIESLRQAYERYFSTYTQTPLLTIDTDDLDYVQDADALAYVEGQVRRALGIGAYQPALPQMEGVGLPSALATLAGAPYVEDRGYAQEAVTCVSEFLGASEAMGRLGSALAQRLGGQPAVEGTGRPGTALSPRPGDVALSPRPGDVALSPRPGGAALSPRPGGVELGNALRDLMGRLWRLADAAGVDVLSFRA